MPMIDGRHQYTRLNIDVNQLSAMDTQDNIHFPRGKEQASQSCPTVQSDGIEC